MLPTTDKSRLSNHKRQFFAPSQPGQQREGQGQARPEGLGRGPEVKGEDVAGPVVGAGGHDPEEDHHGEETAQTNGEVKQCGGCSEPDVEQDQPAEVRKRRGNLCISQRVCLKSKAYLSFMSNGEIISGS